MQIVTRLRLDAHMCVSEPWLRGLNFSKKIQHESVKLFICQHLCHRCMIMTALAPLGGPQAPEGVYQSYSAFMMPMLFVQFLTTYIEVSLKYTGKL
eukprot:scaffold170129_cov29-Prasinocladus_malaysianus.AAC.2